MECIMENIIPSLITGVLALIGVIITNLMNNKSIETKLTVAQAVTDTKLDNLADEVKKHNNFAVEIPVIKEQLKSVVKRIDDLERLRGDDKK